VSGAVDRRGAVAGLGFGSDHADLVGRFAAMTNSDDNTGEYLIYVGYGEVMRRLQILELGLWGLLSRKIKPGTSLGLSVWLEKLDEELDAHMESLGIETPSSLDAETKVLADTLRPEKWFGFVDEAGER
jgi:hypothetical protein